MSNFYVTTPIYYVNDLPHVGHIYSTVVCDTMARFHRFRGDDVYFLTGTDEHGQKIQRAAAEQGVTPIQLADRVVERYVELWDQLGMTHDDLIRTSQERHHRAVQEMVRRIDAKGDFYVARHEGWYCSGCEAFYTDKELTEEKHCPVHERPAEWEAEENVFFRLSKYQEALLAWYDQDPSPVQPRSRRNEVRAFVEGGLRDLSVSRTKVDWGVSFPGHEGHTVYVWLDALTNYISALGFGSDETSLFEKFWCSEGLDDQRVHLIGKDILRFHAVYWPAFLLSAGLPLPTSVVAHGWWLVDEKKMSKSVGNVARPDHLVEEFGADALRLFLLRDMVFGQDASFSDEAFVDRFNSDLANGLGNTLSRLVTLSRRAFDGQTPPTGTEWDGALQQFAEQCTGDYLSAMEESAFHRALEALWRLLGETNQFLVRNEPWKKLKNVEERDQVASVLASGLEAVRIVASALLPVMPSTAPRVLDGLGAPTVGNESSLAWGGLPLGTELPETPSLFPRIDKKKFFAAVEKQAGASSSAPSPARKSNPDATRAEDSPQIDISQFAEVDLRVADVKAAECVPKSKKLLRLTLDLDGVERTVVAGIQQQYAPEDLVGGQVVIVANLKPAKLMGIESQGMVLAASVDGAAVALRPEQRVPSGTRVR